MILLISFEKIKLYDSYPIYQQIIVYIKKGVLSGDIVDGDEVPSRRMISATLGINPNTVQKAFKELEEEGLIISRVGAKSIMKVTESKMSELKQELLTDQVLQMIRSLKDSGLDKEHVLSLINQLWEVNE